MIGCYHEMDSVDGIEPHFCGDTAVSTPSTSSNTDRLAECCHRFGLCFERMKEAMVQAMASLRPPIDVTARLAEISLLLGELAPAKAKAKPSFRPQWSYRHRLAYTIRLPMPNIPASHERRFHRHNRREAIPK